jgi:CheY-like chemotaxis protein
MTNLTPAQSARLARSPVLILTGNRFTGQLVRQLFFGLGIRDVAVAPDPAEARERLSLSRLDLVVADTGLATYDPLEPLVALRTLSDERQAHIPVLLLVTPNSSLDASYRSLENLIQVAKPLSNKPFTGAVLKGLLNIEGEEAVVHGGPVQRERKTTLILSANPYTVQVVRALLLTLGLSDVAVAKDVLEADDKVTKNHFDFVIADYGLTAFDTLGMIEAHRADKTRPLRETPVMLLSSDPSAALVARARHANVQAIVPKPIDADAFSRRVSRVLELNR